MIRPVYIGDVVISCLSSVSLFPIVTLRLTGDSNPLLEHFVSFYYPLQLFLPSYSIEDTSLFQKGLRHTRCPVHLVLVRMVKAGLWLRLLGWATQLWLWECTA